MLEELIITEDNINEYIDKEYIIYENNILIINIKLKKLIIKVQNINKFDDNKLDYTNDIIPYDIIFSSNFCSYMSELYCNNLLNVEEIICNNNKLQELNIDNLINLHKLDCSNNKLQELNINNLINLQELDCSDNNLQKLNISNLINLKELYCINAFGLNFVKDDIKIIIKPNNDNINIYINNNITVLTLKDYNNYLELIDELL